MCWVHCKKLIQYLKINLNLNDLAFLAFIQTVLFLNELSYTAHHFFFLYCPNFPQVLVISWSKTIKTCGNFTWTCK